MAAWEDAPVVEEASPAVAAPKAAWESAPIVSAKSKEPSDWETTKASVAEMVKPQAGTTPGTWDYAKGIGREAFLEANPLVNLGAWAIKKATGQRTTGNLMAEPPEPTVVESLKAAGKMIADRPITAIAELAKGLVYSPELIAVSAAKFPDTVARLAKLTEAGSMARKAAMTGAAMTEGAALMGGLSAVQQSVQKDEVQTNEVVSSAVQGAAIIPAMHLAGNLLGGGRKVGKPVTEPARTPTLDRFTETVGEGGDFKGAIDPSLATTDAVKNAASRAYELMAEGASIKKVERAIKNNPLIEAEMAKLREARADATGAMKDVLQGKVLPPESAVVPRGPRGQRGEADPKLLAGIAAGGLAASYALTHPDQLKEMAASAGALGMVAMTRGRVGEALAKLPEKSLGSLLADSKYTLKTLDRLPQNRTEFPVSMIEQQLKRPDVSKGERAVLEPILEAAKDGKVSAEGLAAEVKLATGDHTLRAVDTSEHATYGLEKVGRPGAQAAITTTWELPPNLAVPKSQHFKGTGIFGHTRSFEEGGIRHVVEVQSDLAQGVKGLKPEEKPAVLQEREKLTKAWDMFKEWKQELIDSPDGKTSRTADEVYAAAKEAGVDVPKSDGMTRVGLQLRELKAGLDNRVLADETKTKLSPMLNNWDRRLIREELGRASAEGKPVVRFATADTVAKVEGWPKVSDMDSLTAGAIAAEQGPEAARLYLEERNKPGKFSNPAHQGIYNRYANETTKYLKSLGGKEVTDAAGHTWLEVPTEAKAPSGERLIGGRQPGGPINQYGQADPKLLAALGLMGLGAAGGAYLAGDNKVLGAVAGGIAAAGLLRLPSTIGALGKTLSYADAAASAARITAVVGAGTYLGSRYDNPIEGAVIASSILLGRRALPAARKLVTDDMLRVRNGNISAEHRITLNLKRDINVAVPEAARREAISEALDRGTTQGLSPTEQGVYRAVRAFNERLGKEAADASVIKGMRSNYISYIVERDPTMTPEQQTGIINRLFESGAFSENASPNTKFGKRGKYDTFTELNKALEGSGLRLKTKDIGEITAIYGKAMRQAIENKILLDNLKKAKSPEGLDYLTTRDRQGNLPPGYKTMQHPQLASYGIHPDLYDSMKVVFDNSDPNVVTRGLLGLSMAVKRVQVYGSLFHAKSLAEVYLNAVGKDAIHGRAPIDAALKQFREGGLGDTLDLGLREGLQMKIPDDVSQTIIADAGKLLDSFLPIKAGSAVASKIDFVNRKLDHVTWEYMHAGVKGALFLKEFETLSLRNAELHVRDPVKNPLKSQRQIAREVATYVNDLTGGLDWYGIAADSKTQLGRNLGMFFASPQGRRFAQIVAFAPDWALSTLRAGFNVAGKSDNALRGLWKPENATDLYRRYAMRSTLYWLTLINGLNLATSGHPVWENKDPTRVEWPDGTSVQVGKHTFEAVHAVGDPAKFAYNKLGFTLKMIVDFMSGKEGYGPTAPKYDSFPQHAAATALPFTVSSAKAKGLTPAQRVGRGVASGSGFPIYGMSAEQKKRARAERLAEKKAKQRAAQGY